MVAAAPEPDVIRSWSRERAWWAAAAFGVVFTSYLVTLAPTLTFWDAGEFITATHVLGIPHPPGTPLFVLLGHVWGLLPLGMSYAAKLNVFSALASSLAAFFYYLVVAAIVDRLDAGAGWGVPRVLRRFAALVAVALGSWALTQWYNSTETEVYNLALMTIGLVTFLSFHWSEHLADGKDWNLLLLVVYLMGLSVGNHLMALLALPAIVGYGLLVTWDTPWRGYAASLVAGGVAVYLVAMKGISIDGLLGEGSVVRPAGLLVGLLVAAAAAWGLTRSGAWRFFLIALGLFAAGVSVFLYLKIRAALDPPINMGNPQTWKDLLAVMARKQYAARPILPRSVDFLHYQVPLWFDYLIGRFGPFESAVAGQFGTPVVSIGVTALAVVGSVLHYRHDRRTWLYFVLLFLVTSLGLIVYLNFPLGSTQAPDVTGVTHEVRERDYFFVVSYVVLGVWAGIGTFGLAAAAWHRRMGAGDRDATLPRAPMLAFGAALVVVPLLVFVLNYPLADRSGDTVPRDFARNLLESVEPWAILVTNGDNDTYPLWYMQEVEGVRRDVSVVVLPLLNTLWHLQELSEGPFTAGHPPQTPTFALAKYGVKAGPRPTRPLLSYSGGADDPLARLGFVLDEPVQLDLSGLDIDLPAQTVVQRQDLAIMELVRDHLGERPIYFSVTVPDEARVGLSKYMVRQGIADRLLPRPPREAAREGAQYLPMTPPETAWIDVPRTGVLLDEVYRLDSVAHPEELVDDVARAMAGNYGVTFLQQATALARRGEVAAAESAVRRGNELLGRPPDSERAVTAAVNVYALAGAEDRLDRSLADAAARSGGRAPDLLTKAAAYNAALGNHYDLALRLMKRGFEGRPQDVEPELWEAMGERALATGDTVPALTFLEGALRSDPDDQRALVLALQAAAGSGRIDRARALLAEWVEAHPGDRAMQDHLDELRRTGRLPAALAGG